MREYRIPAREGYAETVIQKSRFIAQCFPVHSEAEAARRIEETRKRFWDAKHCCYAFRIGANAAAVRSTDDGEPSGTAGAPILDAITGRSLTDALCIVTRYFGGVLLGMGGLVRAYGGAASAALTDAGVLVMQACAQYHSEVGYALWNRVEPLLRSSAVIDRLDYQDRVLVDFSIPEKEAAAVMDLLTERTDGGFSAERTGLSYRGMEAKE